MKQITFGLHATPFGRAVVGVRDRAVVFLSFPEKPSVADARRLLKAAWPQAELVQDDRETAAFAAMPLALNGTDFQRKVWGALRRIPAGQTRTYGQIAKAIGRPKAVRAVGTACGANKVAWLVPCHRVVAAAGGIGGFRWGLARKRAMLATEAVR